MFPMNCRRCRADLPAYIHRELTPRRRQRVSQHLTACADCYRAYREHSDLDRELRSIYSAGAPSNAQLQHMWQGVRAELRPAQGQMYPRWRMRYSAALAVLALAIMLPWTFQEGRALAVPLPPTPQIVNQTDSRLPQVVMSLSTPAPAATRTRQATPVFQPNDAPTLLATDTP
jgi:anti-sigma factor RsiW